MNLPLLKYRKHNVYSVQLGTINSKEYNIRDIVQISLIEEQDIAKYDILKRRKKIFLHYLSRNDIGFKLIYNNRCVGYGWCTINKPKVGHKNVFNQNYLWCHSDYILEDYRGRGFYKDFMKFRVLFLNQRFYNYTLYIDTSVDNIAANRTHKNLKLQLVAKYNYFSLGTLRLLKLYRAVGEIDFLNNEHQLI